MIAFAADLTVVSPVNYVDFAGNIGGVSHYGLGAYGQGPYSRNGAITPVFNAALDLVGTDYFDGNLAPVVTFAADLGLVLGSLAGDLAPVVTFNADLTVGQGISFAGDLAPQVTFAADLTVIVTFAGDLAPQVGLDADLSLDVALSDLQGSFGFTVTFAASSFISGPLWEASTPCPDAPWSPSDPCPPSLWTPVDPCDPVEWEDSELCNG